MNANNTPEKEKNPGPFDLNALIRENISRLKPYQSARDEFTGNPEEAIFLDANEQPAALNGLPEGINRYPKFAQDILKERLAAVRGVSQQQIFLGNGSDEAIDLIMRCFAKPGADSIMVFPPTFGMYAVSAHINDLGIISVPLDSNFMIDAEAVFRAMDPGCRVLFLCNPNNPTANTQDRETMIGIIERFRGIVVVDEAYIDFCPEESLLPELEKHPNLVILQTFSKAWGLAGARVGVAFASQELIGILNKAKAPYNLGRPACELAVKALNNYAEYRISIRQTITERNRLSEALQALPMVEKVYPSKANFLLVKTSDAHAVYSHLSAHRIVVRNRTTEPGCQGCLRITIGTQDENGQLLEAWKKLGKPGSDPGNGTGSDPDSRSGSDPGNGTGSDPGNRTGSDSGSRSGSDPGNGTGSDPGNGTGSDSGSGSDGDQARKTAAFLPPSQTHPVSLPSRTATVRRQTAETDITIRLGLDGSGRANIATGIGFFDHMLQQIARHGLFDLDVEAKGDLHIDAHHTVEDTAITLGQAFRKALGNKKGIERYGFALPMDDSQAKVLIDFGGRTFFKWKLKFNSDLTGELPTSLYPHFFRSFSEAAACNLHVRAKGGDDHHKIEAAFKAFAKALRMAVTRNPAGILPSTKETL